MRSGREELRTQPLKPSDVQLVLLPHRVGEVVETVPHVVEEGNAAPDELCPVQGQKVRPDHPDDGSAILEWNSTEESDRNPVETYAHALGGDVERLGENRLDILPGANDTLVVVGLSKERAHPANVSQSGLGDVEHQIGLLSRVYSASYSARISQSGVQ